MLSYRLSLLILFITSLLVAKEQYVIPTKDNIGVYNNLKHDENEIPIFRIGTSDYLIYLDHKGYYCKIKTLGGNIGWIQKQDITHGNISNKYHTNQVLIPLGDSVRIFSSMLPEVNEKPLIKVYGMLDSITVLEGNWPFYKVKTRDGLTGWIRKTVEKHSNLIDSRFINDTINNPNPVYIVDTDDPNADPIGLNRSFKDSLQKHVGKDTAKINIK